MAVRSHFVPMVMVFVCAYAYNLMDSFVEVSINDRMAQHTDGVMANFVANNRNLHQPKERK